MKELILASASPRRRELLTKMGYTFRTVPAVGEEKTDGTQTPAQTAVSLAVQKATEVAGSYGDAIVIGSDTVVALDGRILGKPRDASDARRMLKLLNDRKHEVVTGVAIVTDGKIYADCAITDVYFNRLSDEEIERYVEGGSPMDKAGAYGIQDGGIVKSYDGSYTNVVGLPVELLSEMLQTVRRGGEWKKAKSDS